MSVQDDARERELVRAFNLQWDSTHLRHGTDALLGVDVDGRRFTFDVEVKSTTTDSVSTARDVGLLHIQKWRLKFFVIGFYSPAPRVELQRSLCLTPIDMEPWIAEIEQKIAPDFELAALASKRLTLNDLFSVCEERPHYTVKDARQLHKKQWSAQEYIDAQDLEIDGKRYISRERMLEVLALRAKYIAERGATLNNPHINATHLATFTGTNREVMDEQAVAIRDIARDFVRTNPGHPAVAAAALVADVRA